MTTTCNAFKCLEGLPICTWKIRHISSLSNPLPILGSRSMDCFIIISIGQTLDVPEWTMRDHDAAFFLASIIFPGELSRTRHPTSNKTVSNFSSEEYHAIANVSQTEKYISMIHFNNDYHYKMWFSAYPFILWLLWEYEIVWIICHC